MVLACSCFRYECTESGGLLLEEVERILQSSQMDSDCRIIITGSVLFNHLLFQVLLSPLAPLLI